MSTGAGSQLPEYYREMVSILFAIVLAQSMPNYINILDKNVIFSDMITSLMALFGAHVTIAGSWIGYHHMLDAYAYKPENVFSKVRLGIDFLIVFMYFLLVTSAQKVSSSGVINGGVNVNLLYHLVLYVTIYSLYVVYDLAVQQSHDDPSAGFVWLDARFSGLFVGVTIAYFVVGSLLRTMGVLNVLFASTPLVLTVVFRYMVATTESPDAI